MKRHISNNVLGNVTAYTKYVKAFRSRQYVTCTIEGQDLVGSYGEENVNNLRTISKQHEPMQIFQKLVSRGWKPRNAGTRNKRFVVNQFGSFESSKKPGSEKLSWEPKNPTGKTQNP